MILEYLPEQAEWLSVSIALPEIRNYIYEGALISVHGYYTIIKYYFSKFSRKSFLQPFHTKEEATTETKIRIKIKTALPLQRWTLAASSGGASNYRVGG